MDPVIIALIVFVVWVGIGVLTMRWIQSDNEFRGSSAGDMLAYGSIVLWPFTALLWLVMRPSEQVQDLAAKKSYQDFKNFMKSRRGMEYDLLSKLEATKTSPEEPMEIGGGEEEFRDMHLEELIQNKEWMEATRTANDMLRFAREQQEYARVASYERYLKEIKNLQLLDM